ncbi:hypothetical protein AJ80_00377 [Polytolypa hystricis UAMH7299]|uniref:Uncharacterized protein n=1 Tax=Polytolypa hystricis (strain UAMH7299) TaxID=1447883 RepID=A0A2B7Z4R2_POLH7|nr:hypothetical protein AJ80_00377 [Polytolypa hystricis UAMH7299]
MAAATTFEEAISVTPITSHTYAANLQQAWCIGTVPNGGYITSLFQNAARTHLRSTHPTQHNGNPHPITLHLTFLRRTEAGPARFTVQDTKLGARTSTLHIALSQGNDADNQREEVSGYITVSNLADEKGPSMTTGFSLLPPATPGSSFPNANLTTSSTFPAVDLSKLALTSRDGAWTSYTIPFQSMRRATQHVEFYTPTAPRQSGFVEQWVRFQPYGKLGRWTDNALGFLLDMFPMYLEGLDDEPWDNKDNNQKAQQEQQASRAKYWYPTVLLNAEIKKGLPAGGVEWLYSRVQTRMLRNGRMDLDIVILDVTGDIVALSNHVSLVVDAERNFSARNKNGNGNGNGKSSKI